MRGMSEAFHDVPLNLGEGEEKQLHRAGVMFAVGPGRVRSGYVVGLFPICHDEFPCHKKQHNARLLHLYIIGGGEVERKGYT